MYQRAAGVPISGVRNKLPALLPSKRCPLALTDQIITLRAHVDPHQRTPPGWGLSFAIMDWQVAFFRIGLFVCVVWAVVASMHFDIVDATVAIWAGNPSSVSLTDAAQRQSACLSAQTHSPSAEYPSHCYSHELPFHGLPYDQAVANLKGFLIALSPLPFLMFGVVSLGLRMARANRAD